MKKIHSILLTIPLLFAGNTDAKPIHCPATYQKKPFFQAVIWSGLDHDGPAECDYKKIGEQSSIIYDYPSQNWYYPLSGNWKSAMPGVYWCSVEDGNRYDACLFAKR